MRAYFYDNKPCPDQGEERERVLIMTEVLADVLETGLMPRAASRKPSRTRTGRLLLIHPGAQSDNAFHRRRTSPVGVGTGEESSTQAAGTSTDLALARVAHSTCATSRRRKKTQRSCGD
jgi:hypothetical protein